MEKRNLIVTSYLLVLIAILTGFWGLIMAPLETQAIHMARLVFVVALGTGAVVFMLHSQQINENS